MMNISNMWRPPAQPQGPRMMAPRGAWYPHRGRAPRNNFRFPVRFPGRNPRPYNPRFRGMRPFIPNYVPRTCVNQANVKYLYSNRQKFENSNKEEYDDDDDDKMSVCSMQSSAYLAARQVVNKYSQGHRPYRGQYSRRPRGFRYFSQTGTSRDMYKRSSRSRSYSSDRTSNSDYSSNPKHRSRTNHRLRVHRKLHTSRSPVSFRSSDSRSPSYRRSPFSNISGAPYKRGSFRSPSSQVSRSRSRSWSQTRSRSPGKHSRGSSHGSRSPRSGSLRNRSHSKTSSQGQSPVGDRGQQSRSRSQSLGSHCTRGPNGPENMTSSRASCDRSEISVASLRISKKKSKKRRKSHKKQKHKKRLLKKSVQCNTELPTSDAMLDKETEVCDTVETDELQIYSETAGSEHCRTPNQYVQNTDCASPVDKECLSVSEETARRPQGHPEQELLQESEQKSDRKSPGEISSPERLDDDER